MSDSVDATASNSAVPTMPAQNGSSDANGHTDNEGPSKPRARLGPVETVTLQEFDPDSDSEDEEEENGEAHIEEIEAQSEDFLKDHPDDTEVCTMTWRGSLWEGSTSTTSST